MRARRSVLQNIGALMVSQSVTWLLATAVLWVMPRYLGVEAIGQFRVAVSISTIIGVLTAWGTSGVLVVEVAKNPALTDRLTRHVIAVRLLMFAVSVPAVGAFVLVAGYDRTTTVVIALAMAALLVGLVYGAFQSTMHGLQEMGATARVEVSSKLLSAGATFGVLAAGAGIVALSFANVALNVVALGFIVFAFSRVRPRDDVRENIASRRLLKMGVPFLLADASLVVYQQIDTIIMSMLVDKVTIGYYASADVLFGSMLFVPTIVMMAAFPALAELHGRDPSEAQRIIERAFRSMLLVAVPVGVGATVVSEPFVRFLYGAEYAPAADVLAVYGVVTVITCMTIVLGRFALATGRERFWAILMAVATALTIPLDLVLVPWTDDRFGNGAIGGALAYVVTETLMVVVGVAYLAPRLVDRELATRLVKCALAAAAMVVAGWPLREHFFLVPLLAAGAAYVVVIVAVRALSPEERVIALAAGRRVDPRRRAR